jgi:D-alanyl-D-alanine endopeptidase (penicillin-binding protein 7)
MYEVTAVHERHYVPVADVVLPQSVVFGGNQIIHGEPQSTVEGRAKHEAGCITVSTEIAATLATAATEATLVVVRAQGPAPKPAADFESKVPNFPTPYYLIADAESDTVLAVGDTHAAVPIASLTKLMTALVVLESVPLNTRLTVAEPSLIASMIPRLRARSEVSAYTLLELLLVESSNEAAEVLASALGREEFIARMNERAIALGLFNTVFTDPAGVEPTNVSSVHDLWWLMRYLQEHYLFLVELTAQTATPPGDVTDRIDALTNFNLLETDPTFMGGKIGETDAAGQTSVTIHRLSFGGTTREVVIVLLGSNARSRDVGALLTYLQERFGQ